MSNYSVDKPVGQIPLSIYVDAFTSTLKSFHVPEHYYSVGKVNEESICIMPRGSLLEVFIWERGEKHSFKTFKQPKSAFMYAISLLAEDSAEEGELSSAFLAKVAIHAFFKRPLTTKQPPNFRISGTVNDHVYVSLKSARPLSASAKKNYILDTHKRARAISARTKKGPKFLGIGKVTSSSLKRKRLQKLIQKLDPLKK